MHLPKSLNLDSTGDERSQMHHKEVTPTFPGSETSMAVGTISFITDDAGRGGGKRIQVRMEKQRGHQTKHSRWILFGSFLSQVNVNPCFLRHEETVELSWVSGDIQKLWPVLGVWFRDSVRNPSFPRLPPCLELHMEVFRGKMMKCQEFSLMYYRKKKRKKRKEWGDVSVGKCWSLLNPGDGSLLYN